MIDASSIRTLADAAWYLIFFIFLFYGQRIQLLTMLQGIKKNVKKLEHMRDEARKALIEALQRFNSNSNSSCSSNPDKGQVGERVEGLLELFTIMPVDLDPRGVVWKLEHILDTYDAHLKDEVRSIAPGADEAQVSNLSDILEVALGLNTMFRIVRHYYLLARKMRSLYVVTQLQMALPSLMQTAEAYHGSLDALTAGKPIGDGVGAMVAAELMGDAERREIAEDTVAAETWLDGRRIIVVKAKGPGGNVGKPGEAIDRLIDEYEDITLIVTVDAGLKLEGEDSGEIIEGVGAAIGGAGVERYKIEEAAAKNRIPLYAIVIKVSEEEALKAMTRRLRESVREAIGKVKKAVVERAEEASTVIVAGIGNTLGIP